MTHAAQRRRRTQTGLAAAFLFAGSAAILLLRFPPEQYSFYPQCPIHTYLHLQCPGCGATRALAALLHGRLTEAFHHNALFIAGVLPATAVYAGLCLLRLQRNEAFRWPAPPRQWGNALLYASLAIALSFATSAIYTPDIAPGNLRKTPRPRQTARASETKPHTLAGSSE